MKNILSDNAKTVLAIAILGLMLLCVSLLLNGCAGALLDRQLERQQETIAAFMDDYGNPAEIISDGMCDAGDLMREYENGEIDAQEILEQYEALQDRIIDELERWERARERIG